MSTTPTAHVNYRTVTDLCVAFMPNPNDINGSTIIQDELNKLADDHYFAEWQDFVFIEPRAPTDGNDTIKTTAAKDLVEYIVRCLKSSFSQGGEDRHKDELIRKWTFMLELKVAGYTRYRPLKTNSQIKMLLHTAVEASLSFITIFVKTPDLRIRDGVLSPNFRDASHFRNGTGPSAASLTTTTTTTTAAAAANTLVALATAAPAATTHIAGAVAAAAARSIATPLTTTTAAATANPSDGGEAASMIATANPMDAAAAGAAPDATTTAPAALGAGIRVEGQGEGSSSTGTASCITNSTTAAATSTKKKKEINKKN